MRKDREDTIDAESERTIWYLFDEMRSHSIAPTIITFNTIIKLYIPNPPAKALIPSSSHVLFIRIA